MPLPAVNVYCCIQCVTKQIFHNRFCQRKFRTTLICANLRCVRQVWDMVYGDSEINHKPDAFGILKTLMAHRPNKRSGMRFKTLAYDFVAAERSRRFQPLSTLRNAILKTNAEMRKIALFGDYRAYAGGWSANSIPTYGGALRDLRPSKRMADHIGRRWASARVYGHSHSHSRLRSSSVAAAGCGGRDGHRPARLGARALGSDQDPRIEADAPGSGYRWYAARLRQGARDRSRPVHLRTARSGWITAR